MKRGTDVHIVYHYEEGYRCTYSLPLWRYYEEGYRVHIVYHYKEGCRYTYVTVSEKT